MSYPMRKDIPMKQKLPVLVLVLFASLWAHADEESSDVEITPVFPSGYLTDSKADGSVYISGSRGTYIGSRDEDGSFIALGGYSNGSAFGRINGDGTVIILYNPVGEEPE